MGEGSWDGDSEVYIRVGGEGVYLNGMRIELMRGKNSEGWWVFIYRSQWCKLSCENLRSLLLSLFLLQSSDFALVIGARGTVASDRVPDARGYHGFDRETPNITRSSIAESRPLIGQIIDRATRPCYHPRDAPNHRVFRGPAGVRLIARHREAMIKDAPESPS